MWLMDKIRDSVESIPLELSRYMGKNEEDPRLSAKARLSNKLNNNVLTPDKIPEFCLPPRLFRKGPQVTAEMTPASLRGENQTHRSNIPLDNSAENHPGCVMIGKAKRKPLPFSAEGYGLAGMYESPNTRRKESLFHAKRPSYLLERRLPASTSKPAHGRSLPQKTRTLPGFLPSFPSKTLSETGSTESDTRSSNGSTALGSPYSPKSSFHILVENTEHATAEPPRSAREQRRRLQREALPPTCSPQSPSSKTLVPPVLFPLDILHCQERLQREHVLPLLGCGKVRLSAERTTTSSSSSAIASLSTVRVRVVSVEGLRDHGDLRPLNCALSLCLTPGKLQRQESATIRNCRSPVFNEDFFFTELSQESLTVLQLRLKVMDKPGSGSLRRGTVIGVITKPLSQLMPQ